MIMPYQRDPLSVALDSMAAGVIDRAISAHRSSRKKTNPRWVPVIFTSPAGYDVPGSAPPNLTRMEIAFKRALYYDARIHKARKTSDRSGPWSLELSWGTLAGRTRQLRVRVFSDTSAARKVRRDYDRGNSYVKNPELRSTWGMDSQEEASR